MWPFKKNSKPTIQQIAPDRYPTRANFGIWMCDQLAYYKLAGYEQWRFFSPYCGEYFPMAAAVGFSYDDEAKSLYSAMKKAHPELVAEARRNHPSIEVMWSRIGDYEDYNNAR